MWLFYFYCFRLAESCCDKTETRCTVKWKYISKTSKYSHFIGEDKMREILKVGKVDVYKSAQFHKFGYCL